MNELHAWGDGGYISVPENRLKELITKYCAWVETAPTVEVCECEWEEDFPVPGGNKVKRLKSTSFECPVHTKEGLLLQFFTWVQIHDRD